MKRPEEMGRDELVDEVVYLRSELGYDASVNEVAELRPLGFPPAEARMVLALQRAMPRVVPKRRLLDIAVPDNLDREGETRVVDIYLCRIRKILGRDALQTVWSAGIRMTDIGAAKLAELFAVQRVRRGGRAG